MDYQIDFLDRKRQSGVAHVESRHLALRVLCELLGESARVTAISVNGRPMTPAQENHLLEQAHLARCVSACLGEEGCDVLQPSQPLVWRTEESWREIRGLDQPLLAGLTSPRLA